MSGVISPFSASPIVTLAASPDQSGAASAAALNAAVTRLPATGGVIKLAPTAPWYIKCGQVVINKSGVYIDAAGCFIYAVGAGDMIRMYDSSNVLTGRAVWGGGLLGMPTIDGTNTTGTASAFHAGDIEQLAVFAQPQNFAATPASIGIWLDNQYFWTEQLYGRIVGKPNANSVVFDNSTGTTLSANATGSFERMNLGVHLESGSTAGNGFGNGVVFQNGAFTSFMEKLFIGGNMPTATTQYAALTLTGSNSGGASNIGAGSFSMGVECDDTAHTLPMTIKYGSSSNFISGPVGSMTFSGMAASNKLGGFNFFGPILGDNTLAAGANFWTPGSVGFPSGITLGSYAAPISVTANGQTINPNGKAFVPLTCAAAFTGLILSSGVADGQMAVIVNQGSGSLTFAAANFGAAATVAVAAGTKQIYIWDSENSLWY